MPNIASEAALATRASSASAEAGILAAVDLGSNSFHMIVGELRHGQLAIIDRLKEMVRLAAGLREIDPHPRIVPLTFKFRNDAFAEHGVSNQLPQ